MEQILDSIRSELLTLPGGLSVDARTTARTRRSPRRGAGIPFVGDPAYKPA